MGFLWISAAFLFVALVPLSVWLRRRERIRSRVAAAVGLQARTSVPRIAIPLALIALLTLGLTRPYTGSRTVPMEARGHDVVVLLDISLSMLATDASPSRLDAARRKIEDLIGELRATRSHNRVALVLFAGEASTLVPLTDDYDAFLLYLRNVSPDLIAARGSSLVAAIFQALATARGGGASRALFLLLTDGEENDLSVDEARRAIADAGTIDTHAVVFGTKKGGQIRLPRGDYLRRASGEIVVSRSSDWSLRQVIEPSGGSVQEATLDSSDLKRILEDLDGEGTARGTRNAIQYDEIGPLLAVSALFLLSFVFAWSPGLLLTIVVSVVSLSEAAADTREGYLLYERGEFARALEEFSEARAQRPDDLAALRGEASAQYRLQRFPESAELFRDLSERASHPKDHFEALYNLGNALLKANKFDEAIEAYTQALAIKPGDLPATSNRTLAERLRAERTPTPTPSPTPSKGEGGSSSREESQRPQGSDPRSSDDSASDKESERSSNDPEAAPSTATPADESASGAPLGTPTPGATSAATTAATSASMPQTTPVSSTPSPEGSKLDDAQALSEEEARAWLQSLPDYPILLRKKNSGRAPQGDQIW